MKTYGNLTQDERRQIIIEAKGLIGSATDPMHAAAIIASRRVKGWGKRRNDNRDSTIYATILAVLVHRQLASITWTTELDQVD